MISHQKCIYIFQGYIDIFVIVHVRERLQTAIAFECDCDGIMLLLVLCEDTSNVVDWLDYIEDHVRVAWKMLSNVLLAVWNTNTVWTKPKVVAIMILSLSYMANELRISLSYMEFINENDSIYFTTFYYQILNWSSVIVLMPRLDREKCVACGR